MHTWCRQCAGARGQLGARQVLPCTKKKQNKQNQTGNKETKLFQCLCSSNFSVMVSKDRRSSSKDVSWGFWCNSCFLEHLVWSLGLRHTLLHWLHISHKLAFSLKWNVCNLYFSTKH